MRFEQWVPPIAMVSNVYGSFGPFQWGGFGQSELMKGVPLKSEQANIFLGATLFQKNILSKNSLFPKQHVSPSDVILVTYHI